MIVPISESNPKIQCQYVLLKAEFVFLEKTETENKIRKEKTKSEKGENKFSPHTPTLYPCIVLNVFNI